MAIINGKHLLMQVVGLSTQTSACAGLRADWFNSPLAIIIVPLHPQWVTAAVNVSHQLASTIFL